MLISEYENLPILEDVKVYSKTEDGFVYVCSRKGTNLVLFKWDNAYFKIQENIPQSVDELIDSIQFGQLSIEQAEKLLKFLKSTFKQEIRNFTVYDAIQFIWEGFHAALKYQD